MSRTTVSKHTTEWTAPPERTPGDCSVDGPLLGNGDLGAAWGGTAKRTRLHLCKNDLWRLEHAYGRSCPVPLGSLEIFARTLTGASYRVRQDLATATTTAVYERRRGGGALTIDAFIAATANALVVTLTAAGRPIDARLTLTIAEGRGAETQAGRDGRVAWGKRAFNDGVDIPTGAAAAWTVVGDHDLGPDGSLLLEPDEPVTLVLAVESVFRHDDYLGRAMATARELANTDSIAELRRDHEQWWADYWGRSHVSIGDAEIEKQYDLSLYGLGSCSRDPGFPPNIFGWVTTDEPMWAGDYHLNYNHQAPFYGLARANRLEQADPHDAPFLDFLERAAWHCREMFGHDGGIYPVGIGPRGIETTYGNRSFAHLGTKAVEHAGMFWGQRTNGSYGLVNMAPRWHVTRDLDYARRVYPFVRQQATFWQHYVAWDDAAGRFVIENDSCHEGSGSDLNSCVSLALCRLALEFALELSETLDTDADRRDAWRHVLDHLSDYTTQQRDGKTVFRYTERGAEWWPSNTIGIQHVYPAGQVHLDSDPELIDVARNTIDVLGRWHDGNGSNSIFPAAVRVGYDAGTILRELREYCRRARPNGFQRDNPHGIENLSTVPNTINEMLCMDHRGVVRPFAVWPRNVDASFANIRCWGAFLVSGSIEAGVVRGVSILSEAGRDCVVVNPWPQKSVRVIRNGKPAEVMEGDRLTLKTSANERIVLEVA